ncbi:DUF636 domain protein [Punctularia strigosozonata HHB-11173 SS5]|uniref:DUF636 domain protein n=1 Tax=Punctularia strigosozonata (strain HHB-11173) TaxID=741275 RepID=UPI0004416C39|nr:DUF636 domain protein [Punctularia strigosozonata HHB-11173 SS5]EIN08037.1 DUF636 domain protein [Punctularia strigosozonata HHB-11173 SS5]
MAYDPEFVEFETNGNARIAWDCRAIEYELTLDSPDSARTSLCHCTNCKKAFGGAFGLTAKVSKDAIRYTKGKTQEHAADNGSGTILHREFCDICGSFILEYGEPEKNISRYVCVASLDDPEALPPKGEFFCKSRVSWMSEIPNVFHKKEINV